MAVETNEVSEKTKATKTPITIESLRTAEKGVQLSIHVTKEYAQTVLATALDTPEFSADGVLKYGAYGIVLAEALAQSARFAPPDGVNVTAPRTPGAPRAAGAGKIASAVKAREQTIAQRMAEKLGMTPEQIAAILADDVA